MNVLHEIGQNSVSGDFVCNSFQLILILQPSVSSESSDEEGVVIVVVEKPQSEKLQSEKPLSEKPQSGSRLVRIDTSH